MIGRVTDFVCRGANWVDGTLKGIPYANNVYITVSNVAFPRIKSFYDYTAPAIREHYYISGGVALLFIYFLIRSQFAEQRKD